MSERPTALGPGTIALTPQRRRFVAIVNPISGRRDVRREVDRIGVLLRRAGGELEVRLTTGPGHASFLTSSHSAAAEGILVVGGDGTVGEVLNGLGEPSPPLLILRTGTSNLLARELGQPASAHLVAETLLRGAVHAVDLGVMNGRRFGSVLGVGFDAECVQRLCETRRGHIGYHSYVAPIWRTLCCYRPAALRVEVDGASFFEGPGSVLIGLIPRYASGLRALRHARNDDGLLDLAVFEHTSRRQLLGHAFRMLFQLPYGPRVRYVQCREVRMASVSRRDVAVQLDGDCAGCLPADVKVLPGAAKFLVPPRDVMPSS